MQAKFPVPKRKEKLLYIGDNLPIMMGMESDTVDLIYADPPFNTSTFRKGKTEAHSFNDTWSDAKVDYAHAMNLKFRYPEMWQVIVLAEKMHSYSMHSYLAFMAPRLVQMHRSLKPTGSLYLHCDPNASYYLRILLDNIFGKKHYQNEFIWYYGGGGASTKRWGRKHDVILFYSKSMKWTFNMDTVRTPHKWDKGQLRADGSKRSLNKGKIANDVFEHHGVMPWAKERTGYDTQKPLALLDRIIKASSNEGDLVMDPFCGCATACVAAGALNRRWIGIDQNTDAPQILRDRLAENYFTYNFETNAPADAKVQKPIRLPTRKVTGYKKISKPKAKLNLLQADYKRHGYTSCKGCLRKLDEKDLTIDHILAQDNGGLDELENLQLLCTSCNSKKGNKDMKFLYHILDDETRQQRMKVSEERELWTK